MKAALIATNVVTLALLLFTLLYISRHQDRMDIIITEIARSSHHLGCITAGGANCREAADKFAREFRGLNDTN